MKVVFDDFSGGMVTDISSQKIPRNILKYAYNIDFKNELGSIVPLKLLSPSSFQNLIKSDDEATVEKLVQFPVQGVKDYVVYIDSNGYIFYLDEDGINQTINEYKDGTVATFKAGSDIVAAGDYIYIHYRDYSDPPVYSRKLIYYDRDDGQFYVEDISSEDAVASLDRTNLYYTSLTPDNWYSKIVICKQMIDGGIGKGYKFTTYHDRGLLPGSTGYGQDGYLIIEIGDIGIYSIYFSWWFPNNEEPIPRKYFEMDSSEKTYIPVFARVKGEDTYFKIEGTGNGDSFLALLQLYSNGERFIDIGHKIKIGTNEFEIVDIQYDDSNDIWTIEMDRDVSSYSSPGTGATLLLEVETVIYNNFIFVPLSKDVPTGSFIDDDRPEVDYLFGVGNGLAFAANRLIVANPYFPDTYSTGKDEDKPGFVSWGFIDGSGRFVNSIIPNTNLLSTTRSGSQIVSLFSFKENVYLVQKGNIARFVLSPQINLYEQKKYGAIDKYKIYVDDDNIFLINKNKLYISNDGIQYRELTSSINKFLSDWDFSLDYVFFDNLNELLFTMQEEEVCLICDMRDGSAVWVSYVPTMGQFIRSGFFLNGVAYYLGWDDVIYTFSDSAYEHYIYAQSHDLDFELLEKFINSVELVYLLNDLSSLYSNVKFKLYLDDTLVLDEKLSTSSTGKRTVQEFGLDRGEKTRFSRLRWELVGNDITEFALDKITIDIGVIDDKAQSGL